MRILVTGAAGFLGKYLCQALTGRGDHVVGLVRDITAYDPLLNIDCVDALVLGSFEQVERALAEYEVDVVYHLAAQTQVSTAVADPTGTWETNVGGTWRVLEACRRQRVKRVVVASSDKVYGDGAAPYVEDQPLLAHGVYATSKACADLVAQSYAREFGMSVVVTRCGNLYGPGHVNWSTLIPGTIRSVLRGERPRLRSNGGPKRDYLYVADAVDAYLRLSDFGVDKESHIFNFGTGRGTSAIDAVNLILKLMDSHLKPIVGARKSVEIDEQVLDSSRAARILGWGPTRTLESGLAETIKWYREYLKESK